MHPNPHLQNNQKIFPGRYNMFSSLGFNIQQLLQLFQISSIDREKGKKNTKQNHIEFAYLIKWLDSLEIPNGVAICRNRNRDSTTIQKENNFDFEKEIWSCHHSLFWKTTEKP